MIRYGIEEMDFDSTGHVGDEVTRRSRHTHEYGKSQKSRQFFSRTRDDKTSSCIRITAWYVFCDSMGVWDMKDILTLSRCNRLMQEAYKYIGGGKILR